MCLNCGMMIGGHYFTYYHSRHDLCPPRLAKFSLHYSIVESNLERLDMFVRKALFEKAQSGFIHHN